MVSWRMRRSCLLLAGLALTLPSAIGAHPGGLNSQGCHNNRKTGEYHCHAARPQQSASAPIPQRGGDYFPNCDAARAAGRAPIRRGEPGYRPALDRDNDGIACEPPGSKR